MAEEEPVTSDAEPEDSAPESDKFEEKTTEEKQGEDRELNRRGFLTTATVAIGGIITVGIAVPAVAYVIGPASGAEQTQNWIRLGPTSKVEIGQPTLFKVTVTNQTGWIVNDEEISIYVLTENGRDYIALSSVCTHLGCRVRWINEQGEYLCPCHNGIFDKEGLVVSGPPPRPLDRYEVKVEDDQLFVLGG
jgi:quinol---cytochrome c reductase iron-sulfur subunit, bacillus type